MTMNNIEKLSKELIEYYGNFIFPEYYSHTDCDMWKILNPFTLYKEDKVVLCPVDSEDAVERALTIALATMAKKKEEWLKHPELHT